MASYQKIQSQVGTGCDPACTEHVLPDFVCRFHICRTNSSDDKRLSGRAQLQPPHESLQVRPAPQTDEEGGHAGGD